MAGLQTTWNELTYGRNIITDLGKCAESQDRKPRRYAVWIPDVQRPDRHRIAEVGDDLKALSKKYKVKTEDIFRVEAQGGEA